MSAFLSLSCSSEVLLYLSIYFSNFVIVVVTAMLTAETMIAPIFLFYLFIFSIHKILCCTMNVDLEYLTIFV